MITQADIIVLEQVLLVIFILFLLGVFGAVTLYLKASKFKKFHGWKVDRLYKGMEADLKGRMERFGEGDLGDRGQGTERDEGVPEQGNGPDQENEGEPSVPIADIISMGAKLRAMANYHAIAVGSLMKASLWMFLTAYAALQTMLALRLEVPYFNTQYSIVGFFFGPLLANWWAELAIVQVKRRT